MKVRNGFVSNSSSSSFILSVTGNGNIDALEVLYTVFSSERWKKLYPQNFSGQLSEYLDTLEKESEKLGKDIQWQKEKVGVLERIRDSSEAGALFDEWDSISEEVHYRRYHREHEEWKKSEEYIEAYKDDPQPPKVEVLLNWARRAIQESTKEQEGLQSKIAKLTAVEDEGLKIFVLEASYQGNELGVINSLISKGYVDVIERIDT